jgi:hypothetical protein
LFLAQVVSLRRVHGINNQAASQGGVLLSLDSMVNVSESDFEHNSISTGASSASSSLSSCSNNGGGVLACSGRSLATDVMTVHNTLFWDNLVGWSRTMVNGVRVLGSGSGDGGAVLSAGCSLTVSESNFLGNEANGAGGAIFVLSGSCLVRNSSVTYNTV